MITADRMTVLGKLTAQTLTVGIRRAGYKRAQFETAKFLGMTNGGQFCYEVTWVNDGEPAKGKVFATFDPERDTIRVDY